MEFGRYYENKDTNDILKEKYVFTPLFIKCIFFITAFFNENYIIIK